MSVWVPFERTFKTEKVQFSVDALFLILWTAKHYTVIQSANTAEEFFNKQKYVSTTGLAVEVANVINKYLV